MIPDMMKAIVMNGTGGAEVQLYSVPLPATMV